MAYKYEPTEWINNVTALNAEHLNNMEAGIAKAHEQFQAIEDIGTEHAAMKTSVTKMTTIVNEMKDLQHSITFDSSTGTLKIETVPITVEDDTTE